MLIVPCIVSPDGSVQIVPSEIDAERNTTQQFTCLALGGPGNNFTWTRLRDGQALSNNLDLEILVEDASVGSQYECLVENNAGSENEFASLRG